VEQKREFEIELQGIPGADQASVHELPSLSAEEMAIAKKLGISSEDYQRSKLALDFARQRQRERAFDLGDQVAEILAELDAGYKLARVAWNTSNWRLEFETPGGQQNVALSWELVDDALDSRTRSELQRLRNMVLFGLGRQELIVKH